MYTIVICLVRYFVYSCETLAELLWKLFQQASQVSCGDHSKLSFFLKFILFTFNASGICILVFTKNNYTDRPLSNRVYNDLQICTKDWTTLISPLWLNACKGVGSITTCCLGKEPSRPDFREWWKLSL